MEETLFSVIGNRYADKLGYEHLIGAYAVVTEKMKALYRVMVISAQDPKLVGQEADVHKEDLELERNISQKEYMVLIDIDYGEIIYSENKELMKYFISRTVGKRYLRYPAVDDLSEVIDIVSMNYSYNPDDPDNPRFFKQFNLDEPQPGYKYSDMVQRFHLLEEARRKGNEASIKLEEVKANLASKGFVFGDLPKDPPVANQSLTDALRRQLEAKANEMETLPVIEFEKLESHGVDRDEDDYEGKGGGWGIFWNL